MPFGKRKRTSNESGDSNIKEEELNLEDTIDDIRENQKLILEKLENQGKILEKLGNNSVKKEVEEPADDKKPSFNSVISLGFLTKNAPRSGIASVGKSFVLKHTFEYMSLIGTEEYDSDAEDHFGVSWSLQIAKNDQHLCANLRCNQELDFGNWAINTNFTIRLVAVDGQVTSENVDHDFGNASGNRKLKSKGLNIIEWDELKKNYVVEDKLAVEVHVEISEMTGVYRANLRSFDESMKDVSDVVLAVGNRKFHVLKLYLATHSSYFKTLFLGQFQESNRSEIELTGIDPEDFQKYLEVLYGDTAIDEFTVEGILLVADMYDTPSVIKKCVNFLSQKSRKLPKKMLQMAIRYNLDEFKKKCISKMNTRLDIKSVVPENPDDLDHATMAELLNKSLSLRYT